MEGNRAERVGILISATDFIAPKHTERYGALQHIFGNSDAGSPFCISGPCCESTLPEMMFNVIPNQVLRFFEFQGEVFCFQRFGEAFIGADSEKLKMRRLPPTILSPQDAKNVFKTFISI
jgi:hypothetical protein